MWPYTHEGYKRNQMRSLTRADSYKKVSANMQTYTAPEKKKRKYRLCSVETAKNLTVIQWTGGLFQATALQIVAVVNAQRSSGALVTYSLFTQT